MADFGNFPHKVQLRHILSDVFLITFLRNLSKSHPAYQHVSHSLSLPGDCEPQRGDDFFFLFLYLCLPLSPSSVSPQSFIGLCSRLLSHFLSSLFLSLFLFVSTLFLFPLFLSPFLSYSNNHNDNNNIHTINSSIIKVQH